MFGLLAFQHLCGVGCWDAAVSGAGIVFAIKKNVEEEYCSRGIEQAKGKKQFFAVARVEVHDRWWKSPRKEKGSGIFAGW